MYVELNLSHVLCLSESISYVLREYIRKIYIFIGVICGDHTFYRHYFCENIFGFFSP